MVVVGMPTTPAITSAHPAIIVANRRSFLEIASFVLYTHMRALVLTVAALQEIAKQRERDDEHRNSQQQLGHPTLEETFNLWSVGEAWRPTMTREPNGVGQPHFNRGGVSRAPSPFASN